MPDSLTEESREGVTIPTMLANLLEEEKKISLKGCLLQAYFLHSFGSAECYLLTTMAYDRYLAICKPLHYSSIMTMGLFIKLAAACIISGFLSPVIGAFLISSLPFCGPNCIQTLFCDFLPLIALACTDTKLHVLVEFVVGSVIILLSCIFVLQSYSRIIHVILKIKSRKGRQKTFSTCGAHLIVVVLFFGSISFTYIRLSESYSADYDRAVGVAYAIFTPLANPVIYGLRNQGIKNSLQKHLRFSLLF
ncbi:hypothetical protein XENTR_v10018957 [Xenopus tropicalis]|nr:hypothetical protein XENTR_v10018957 [Xenopus tropicalis]KAE8593041.1 hypothetical protein XENTR_v10018957 [Xenopus tropicalis]